MKIDRERIASVVNFFKREIYLGPSLSEAQKIHDETVEICRRHVQKVEESYIKQLNMTESVSHERALIDAMNITATVAERLQIEDDDNEEDWKIPVREDTTKQICTSIINYMKTGESDDLNPNFPESSRED